MGLLRSREGRSADPLAGGPASEEQPAEGAPVTRIDEGAELEGVLRCAGPLRLAGSLRGEVHCQGTVVVAQGARVHARVEAECVVVSGEVRGDIHARRKITLDGSARVTGDLETPGIVIEEGAVLEGRILIGKGPAREPVARPAPRAARPPAATPGPPPPPAPGS